MVGHRDFARLRHAAASDHAGVRDRVVRRPKGAGRQQRFARSHAADGRVDAGRFEALFGCEWRKDRGHAAGEHRLPAAGRTQHDDVVAAGRGDGQRPLGELLAADVAEVHVVAVQLRLDLLHPGRHRFDHALSGDQAHRLIQRRDAEHLQVAHHGRFLRVRGRHDQPLHAAAAGLHRHRQRPAHRPHAAVEGEFADAGAVVELVGGELLRGEEQAERDGQVERPGVLAQVGRGEVDDGAAGRAEVAEVGERPLDAMDALADGEFGQAHQHRLGHVRRHRIDFDLDRDRVDPEQGEGAELGEHDTPPGERGA